MSRRKGKSSDSVELDLGLYPKQTLALKSGGKCVTMYGGAAGGGKSHLLRIAAVTHALASPGVSVYLVRKELTALLKNHMTGKSGLPALLQPLVERKFVKIDNSRNIIKFRNGGINQNQWAGGSTITLMHLQRGDSSLDSIQGAEIQVLLLDESTHFSKYQIQYMFGRIRLGGWRSPNDNEFSDHYPLAILATNPGGISHDYHKTNYASLEPYIRHKAKDVDAMDKMFIPSMIPDNPNITKTYIANLKANDDKMLVRALLFGDWSISSGSLFEHSFKQQHCVLESIQLPPNSILRRGYDHGSSEPYVVLYYYTCEEDLTLLANGEPKNFPEGSIIIMDEIYGADPDDHTKGLKTTDYDIGKQMKEHEEGVLSKYKIIQGPCDSAIMTKDNNRKMIIADINKGYFGREVYDNEALFHPYWKPAGSRVAGANKMNSMFLATHLENKMEEAGLFLLRTCKYCIMLNESIPRHPMKFDAAKGSCDHCYDTQRYIVLYDTPEFQVMQASVF